MKKVLIHSIVFHPDKVSTAYLYNDIALKFKENGYEVVVLTTTPHYSSSHKDLTNTLLSKKLFGLYYESSFNGIRVFHISLTKSKHTLIRVLSFIYWHIVSFFFSLTFTKISAIISPSPPLTIAFLNILIAKIKKAKTIYNVQEIYPDLLIHQGSLKFKPIISLLKCLETFVYKHSDAVATIDSEFYKTIVPRFKKPEKLHIIPNFVDTKLYKPIDISDSTPLSNELFPVTDKLKLMYAGNIGLAQNWEMLINLAKLIRNEPIEFIVIGDGVKKEWLYTQLSENNLSNIRIIPYQDRAYISEIYAYADLHFIFMNASTDKHGFPSKVYSIMACAKPLLVCSGENSPIVNFLKNQTCAFIVKNKPEMEQLNEIAGILKTVNKETLKNMGKSAVEVIQQQYSMEVITQQYVELSNNMLG